VPAVPATYSPAVPALYGDTRTGATVGVKSSGELGFQVQAAATAGSLNVKLPVLATLDLPTEFITGKSVRVAGTASIDSSASFDVFAPALQAKVSGIIQTNNEMGITACFIGAGCDSTSSHSIIDETFEIVSLDTASERTVTALGLPLPIVSGVEVPINAGAQTVGHVVLTTPQDQSGGSISTDGQSLALDTRQSVIKTTADFGGIAQVALAVPVDVLQPSLDFGPGSIGAVLINLQGGVDLSMSQSLTFHSIFQVSLLFDQLITMTYEGQTFAPSHTVSFDLEKGADLMFSDVVGRLVSRTYSVGLDSLLTNLTSVSIDPLFDITAGCYSMGVTGVADISQCLLEKSYSTKDLLAFNVYNKSFALQGFNEVSVSAVPVPAAFWLFGSALAGLAGFCRRKRFEF
jgi:hypothetical protein